jgi:predicted nucleic acid-binding Zn ribbon protein
MVKPPPGKRYDPNADLNAVKARQRAPELVQGILKAVLKNKNLDKDLARYKFVTEWESIVGKQIAAVTRVEAFRGTTLVIRVADNMWAQELQFHKEPLVKRLQRHAGEDVAIEDIRFYVAGARGVGW